MSINPGSLISKLRIGILGAICFIGLVSKMEGQTDPAGTSRVVQISGRVIAGEEENPVVLPYVIVAVKGTNRGTYTDLTGFFSIVVRTDETLVFSVLGYKNAYFPIPDTLTGDYHSIIQILYQDTFMLPVTVIYPWPDPDNFTQEFLAMDVHDDLEDIAAENVSAERMQFLRENLPSDGPEHTQLYLKEQNKKYYYEGQIRPQQIFNVFAWKEFIDAWKRGDFKKKK
jgi:hypothetical protein